MSIYNNDTHTHRHIDTDTRMHAHMHACMHARTYTGSLSKRRKTLIQNRGWRSPLASPCDGRIHQSSRIFPAIGFWICFIGDVGRRGATPSHVKNLTAQTWRSTHMHTRTHTHTHIPFTALCLEFHNKTTFAAARILSSSVPPSQ